MPRRNQRDGDHEPLSITPADIPNPPRSPRRETYAEREARLDREAERRRAQAKADRRKRIAAAITDWKICLIPGCDLQSIFIPEKTDVDLYLPICNHHAVIIKRQLDPRWGDDDVVALRRQRQQLQEQYQDAMQRVGTMSGNGGATQGQIYFVRLNGLIKVGWSGDLTARLKAYGPEVEILCHYKASRRDETLMHRQLRPYLARGREWYHDCKLIADVVTGIVKQHGEPHLSAFWTAPKADPIRPRRSA